MMNHLNYQFNKLKYSTGRKSITKNILVAVFAILISIFISIVISVVVYQKPELFYQII
jgi:hypothetical protein